MFCMWYLCIVLQCMRCMQCMHCMQCVQCMLVCDVCDVWHACDVCDAHDVCDPCDGVCDVCASSMACIGCRGCVWCTWCMQYMNCAAMWCAAEQCDIVGVAWLYVSKSFVFAKLYQQLCVSLSLSYFCKSDLCLANGCIRLCLAELRDFSLSCDFCQVFSKSQLSLAILSCLPFCILISLDFSSLSLSLSCFLFLF